MAAAPLLPDQQRRLFACSLSCPQLAWPVKAGYAEGDTVLCGTGAYESDRDEVAMDIVYNNSPILYQSSIDVEIARHCADAISLQSRRYTGLIALHEALHQPHANRPFPIGEVLGDLFPLSNGVRFFPINVTIPLASSVTASTVLADSVPAPP